MRPVGARLLHLLLLYRYTSQTVSYFDRISRGPDTPALTTYTVSVSKDGSAARRLR